MYEILFIENGIYYINYYPDTECKPIRLKLGINVFMKWKIGKVER